ncbi:serine hydrolase [Kangiella sp. HZ709]|uniref:serine hydrolase domain-containing protein n=1 Tax=Kangiella sp. HZ709 TaxID=2666328 RepID=UPI0018A226D1|nr:serine hydrolase domain-containing protein [Kangiella sp. HZ709]
MQKGFSGHVLIADKNKIIFNNAYGTSSIDQPMKISERWRWASVTKQLTSVAIMQLIEEKLLSLETTLSESIPAENIPNADIITIKDLLQHTSGLINDSSLPDESFANGFNPRDYCKGIPKTEPGKQFDYNNCDYIVLGLILEKIDQKSWFESLNDRIFKPANMHSMQIGKNNGNETVTGFIRDQEPSPKVYLPLYEASGELVGEAYDLLKFNRALLSNKLLNNHYRSILWKSKPEYGYAALGQWVFPASLNKCNKNYNIVERRGAISGVKVLNLLIPEKEISIITFINREEWDWGAIWMQSGFAYELLSATLCD